jgi:hypothetical protein
MSTCAPVVNACKLTNYCDVAGVQAMKRVTDGYVFITKLLKDLIAGQVIDASHSWKTMKDKIKVEIADLATRGVKDPVIRVRSGTGKVGIYTHPALLSAICSLVIPDAKLDAAPVSNALAPPVILSSVIVEECDDYGVPVHHASGSGTHPSTHQRRLGRMFVSMLVFRVFCCRSNNIIVVLLLVIPFTGTINASCTPSDCCFDSCVVSDRDVTQ